VKVVEDMVTENRRITVDEVADALYFSRGSAYSILNDRLNFRKVCAIWLG
jgi:predicted transcriptional regulator